MSDLLQAALLQQTRQRPRQSASSRLAEQLMRQAGQQGPVYGTLGVLSRALPGVLGAYMAQRGADEERVEEKARFGRLEDMAREQREEAANFFRPGGMPAQAPQMPAQPPMMPPGGDVAREPLAPPATPVAMPAGMYGRNAPLVAERDARLSADPMQLAAATAAGMPNGQPQFNPARPGADAPVPNWDAGLAPPTGRINPNVAPPAMPGAMPPQAAPGGMSGLPPGVTMEMLAQGLAHPNPQIRQQAAAMVQVAQLARREQRAPINVAPGGTLFDPNTGRPIFTAPERPREPREPPESERNIARMVQNGIPENVARGIVSGQFRMVSNDMDGTIRVFDVANGRVVHGPGAQPQQPPQAAAPPDAPSPGTTPPQAGAPPPAVNGGTMPTEGVDFPGATGGPGLVAETANYVADLFGGNLPAPETARAAQALRNLDTRTRMFLQTAIPGRPSNYLMEMIGNMTVSPATLSLGPERATERVQQTTRFLEQTIREQEAIANSMGTGQFDRNAISQANTALLSLRPLLNDYQTLERAFVERGTTAQRERRRGTTPLRQQQNAPQPGTVQDGYMFRGGNPADPASWERAE
jgi:hypothetical protein